MEALGRYRIIGSCGHSPLILLNPEFQYTPVVSWSQMLFRRFEFKALLGESAHCGAAGSQIEFSTCGESENNSAAADTIHARELGRAGEAGGGFAGSLISRKSRSDPFISP